MAGKKLLSGNGWSLIPATPKASAEPESLPPDRQKATVKLEKRAKGKTVTLVTGFVLSHADRKALAATLKKSCGAGGSDAPEHIEIQGDRREDVSHILAEMGWRVR